ncbi:SDR family oxidoreductase [Microbispora siamensis]|uniref:Nucleotide-diphosphate-sugar epimerase n=1 Tax=Microbispora siamensis TaxID=564413 RepID=A0ABQ4GMV7_9ACTN|nr:NAD(P)H-binding protein [Microbispora siamensis]GIH62767.1 nucleotide-diphosphate-sugar epimerase [Microbispora siamensis]
MILVTGGRGAVATHLLTLLLQAGRPVRVASSDPAQLRVPDGVTAVTCDLRDPATFPAALAGVTEVFLYAEASHIADFVDAAVTAGVEHVVLLSSASVLDPGAAGNPLAKSHLDVETALLAAPLTTTILRPGSFAGNAGAWAWPIKAGRPVSLPYPGSHTDPIHERDLAEVAFTVLTDPRHQGRRLHLTGPESLTFSEQIEQLAEIIDRPVTVDHVTPEEWKQEMADYLPGPYADALLDYWEANDGRPVPLTGTVEQVTGHAPRTFATWARDHVADFAD